MIREIYSSNCEPLCSYFLGTSISCEQRRWEELTGLEGLYDANFGCSFVRMYASPLFCFCFWATSGNNTYLLAEIL